MNARNKKWKLMAIAMSIGAVMVAGAETLSLTGTGDVTWDRTTPVWSDGSSLVPYTDGADVTIGSQYTGSNITFPKAMRVNPGKVKFEIGTGRFVNLCSTEFTSGFGPQTESYEKTGEGTLMVRFENEGIKSVASTEGNQSSCDWDVKGGMLIGYGKEWWRNFNTFGATMSTNVNVFVRNGATLGFNASSIGGDYGEVENEEDTGLCVTVDKGGTFRPMNTNVTVGSTTFSGNVFCRMREINMNGGALEIHRDGVSNTGSFKVTHLFSFDGDAPYVFSIGENPWWHAGFALASTRKTEIRVADITKDDRTDVSISLPIRKPDKNYTKPMGMRKTGSGRLELSAPQGNYGARALDGDIDVDEGVLEFSATGAIYPVPDRKITVLSGATLDLTAANVLSTNNAWDSGLKTEIVVKDGGRYVVRRKSGTAATHHFVGSMDLRGGVFDYSALPGNGTTEGSCELFTLGSRVAMSGDTPYTWDPGCLTNLVSGRRRGIHLCPGGTTFDIADITGNEGIDFNITHSLLDDMLTKRSCGIVKLGTGTMCIPWQNMFSGDIVVSNGVLRLGASSGGWTPPSGVASFVGDLRKPHMVEVADRGVLHMANRFVNAARSKDGTNTPAVVSYVARKGGTISNTCYVVYGDVWLDGGEFYYSAGEQDEGIAMVCGTFKFSGDRPYTFARTAIRESISLNAWPQTVFDVADITGDAETDVSMNLALTVPPECYPNHKLTEGYSVGFRKTGAGTLRLGYAYADYYGEGVAHFNGDVQVEEGTLQVDTEELKKCNTIFVSAGAALCGTGMVNNVSFASGALLTAKFDQKSPLTVTGRADIPENGYVDIQLPAGEPEESITAEIIKISGVQAGDFDQWQVRVNGVTNPNVRLVNRGGQLSAKFNQGLMLIIR